jgi:tRNA-dihydrouridine synthase B
MRDPVGIALRCQDAGARVIALHARTRTQMYSGSANWDEIARVAEALDIPVLGNGDIKTPQDALRMREHTRCDGVMIGRGSYGQPWIFRQTRALLDGTDMPATPGVRERFAIALDHARMVQQYEVDAIGAALEFRKHLGWYVKGLPNSADLRKLLHQVRDFAEVETIFARYLDGYDALVSRGAVADDPDVSTLTCEAA